MTMRAYYDSNQLLLGYWIAVDASRFQGFTDQQAHRPFEGRSNSVTDIPKRILLLMIARLFNPLGLLNTGLMGQALSIH